VPVRKCVRDLGSVCERLGVSVHKRITNGVADRRSGCVARGLRVSIQGELPRSGERKPRGMLGKKMDAPRDRGYRRV
jgi:hypothetical protein